MSPTQPSSDAAHSGLPSADQEKTDRYWMRRALALAHDVRGLVWPNPPVGCVVVKEGHLIAEGATHPGGRPHAERKALEKAGQAAKGATLYVTLEPCCHWGQSPPCTEIIQETEIVRVVCAIQDPDPRVNGGGFATLRAAGIEVDVGICAQEAERVMSGFFHRVRTGEPQVMGLSRMPDTVPAGADAVLLRHETGAALRTRSDRIEIPNEATDNILRWMGDQGVTTIAVLQGDPLLPNRPQGDKPIMRFGKPIQPMQAPAAKGGAEEKSLSDKARALWHIQRVKRLVRDQLGSGVQCMVSVRTTICTDPGCEGPVTEIRIVTAGFREVRTAIHLAPEDVKHADIAAVLSSPTTKGNP